MKKLILVRHCSTPLNQSNIFQGSTDGMLNELGQQQAAYLAKRFKGISFDKIWASPMKRTKQTAEAMMTYHPDVKIEYDERLREIDGGIFENKQVESFLEEYPEILYNLYFRPGLFAAPGGESGGEVYRRVVDFFESLLRTEAETIVIVSHGYVLLMFYNWLQKKSLADMEKKIAKNASISIININTPEDFNIEIWDDVSHLPKALQKVFVSKEKNNAKAYLKEIYNK